jgi:hypothetical protein
VLVEPHSTRSIDKKTHFNASDIVTLYVVTEKSASGAFSIFWVIANALPNNGTISSERHAKGQGFTLRVIPSLSAVGPIKGEDLGSLPERKP